MQPSTRAVKGASITLWGERGGPLTWTKKSFALCCAKRPNGGRKPCWRTPFGVNEGTVSRWINGSRWPTQGPTRVKLLEWAERKKSGDVREPSSVRGAVLAQGRGVELEALMAYVLTRQQLLNEYTRQLELSIGIGPAVVAR